MAGVAGTGTVVELLLRLLYGLDSYLVATGAALKAIAPYGLGLVVKHGHGLHGYPCKGVLAFAELDVLIFMAASAGFWRWHLDVRSIVGSGMVRAVAGGAIQALAHLTLFELFYDAGCDLFVATYAFACRVRNSGNAK